MKNHLRISIYILLILSALSSCKKEKAAALSTSEITNILGTAAMSGGTITNDGAGSVNGRGVCWSTDANPTVDDSKTQDGDGSGTYASRMTGLKLSTDYYVRAYATSDAGTAYGNQLSFNTGPVDFNPDLTYATVTDIDGNIYKTIQIGDRTWMAENLRTSKYNDGSPVPDVADSTDWSNAINYTYDPITDTRIYQGTGAYCLYGNNPSSEENGYGKLYDFFAVKTAKLCPAGWHVPAYEEWSVFGDPFSLSIGDIIGSELMEKGTTHWNRPDFTGTNETGFTALPGGFRTTTSSFGNLTYDCEFWTSDESVVYKGNARYYPIPVTWNYAETPSSSIRKLNAGLSVRCIMDNQAAP